jgi:hypothetical protein
MSVRIDRYGFGEVQVEGHSYKSDVIVGPEQVRDGWWRQQGHSLSRNDLAPVLELNPDVLVVGTGYFGRMRIPEETRRFLASRGIGLWAGETGKAVKEFNRLQAECARVVAALHLTC